jgi:hypothetical protein
VLGPVLTVLPFVAFYIFVSIFSDGAESSARGRIFVLSLVVTVVLRVISNTHPTLLGLGVACLVASAVSIAGLMLWLKVTRLQALKITGSYIGFVVGLSIVMALILRARAA